jgi:hypothetical protein
MSVAKSKGYPVIDYVLSFFFFSLKFEPLQCKEKILRVRRDGS